ncbi:hypothetical protein AB6A40_007218 [Gnathostoma spinigerum]|uniref:Uncharacterized protein n=1 Tax=Gnathostoma spinigerum TaxID=75299 RepID=A0ABD6ET86_9BILA
MVDCSDFFIFVLKSISWQRSYFGPRLEPAIPAHYAYMRCTYVPIASAIDERQHCDASRTKKASNLAFAARPMRNHLRSEVVANKFRLLLSAVGIEVRSHLVFPNSLNFGQKLLSSN